MKNIIMISTYETIKKNENDFYGTEDIVYSILYNENGNEKEVSFFNNNVPNFALDFIDNCKYSNNSYFENGSLEMRETNYFN